MTPELEAEATPPARRRRKGRPASVAPAALVQDLAAALHEAGAPELARALAALREGDAPTGFRSALAQSVRHSIRGETSKDPEARRVRRSLGERLERVAHVLAEIGRASAAPRHAARAIGAGPLAAAAGALCAHRANPPPLRPPECRGGCDDCRATAERVVRAWRAAEAVEPHGPAPSLPLERIAP
jgi:hypothetical protein